MNGKISNIALIIILFIFIVTILVAGGEFLKFTDPPYLFDDTDTVFFNESHFNKTVLGFISATQVTYFPYNFSIQTGTWTVGNISSIFTRNDGDSINITEVTGTPGFVYTFNFTNISGNFNQIHLNTFYMGSAGHTVVVQLYNFVTGGYETIDTLSDQSSLTFTTHEVENSTPFISDLNVSLRINHSSAGNPTHEIETDYVALQLDSSGIQCTVHDCLGGRNSLENHLQYLDITGTRAVLGNFSVLGNVNTNWINSTDHFNMTIDDGRVLDVVFDGTRGQYDFNNSDLNDVNILRSNNIVNGNLFFQNNEIISVVSNMVLNSGSGTLFFQDNGNELCRMSSFGVACQDEMQVYSDTTTRAVLRINATGGVYDGIIIFENDGVLEWYLGFDDSGSDVLQIGVGGTVGLNPSITFTSTAISMQDDTTFSSVDAIISKGNLICLPGALPRNPTTIDVTKGCMYTTANTAPSTVTSITSTDGSIWWIVCDDTSFALQDNANINILGGASQTCNTVGDMFECIDKGSYVTCDYVRT